MKKNIKFGITMVAIFIWCGMMYPELVFTENVFCVLEQENAAQEDGAHSEGGMQKTEGRPAAEYETGVYETGVYETAAVYRDFLRCEPEQIEVKSRILEWLGKLQSE